MATVTPWLRSPFTDLTGNLINHQWYGHCAELEMKVMDCMEAYGMERGLIKCDTLIQDFKECFFREKQYSRFMAMRLERHRQYKAGERSKEDLYCEPPKIDSF